MSEIHQAPRNAQLAVGLLYVAIVLLGSIASYTSLGENNTHYLASKSNFLNQAFVKRGWLWFTVVFWGAYAARRSSSTLPLKRPMAYHVVARYAAATLWWVLFTQWLFGPPLMDRVFTFTGGSCTLESPGGAAPPPGLGPVPPPPAGSLKAGLVCRRLGGLWAGGHDPSGHVFLLVHSSVVLWMEILPDLWSRRRLQWSTKVPLGLLLLWGFMLFLTATYFHSFAEKLSGLLFGFAESFVVYIVGETASWGWVFGVNAHRPPFPVQAAGPEPAGQADPAAAEPQASELSDL